MSGVCNHFYNSTVLAYIYIFPPPPVLISVGFHVFVTRKSYISVFQN